MQPFRLAAIGPGFAERYLRGQTALYGETCEYVQNVLARFSASR